MYRRGSWFHSRVVHVVRSVRRQGFNTNSRQIGMTMIIDPIDLHKRYLSLLLSLASVHFCTDELLNVVVHRGTIDSY